MQGAVGHPLRAPPAAALGLHRLHGARRGNLWRPAEGVARGHRSQQGQLRGSLCAELQDGPAAQGPLARGVRGRAPAPLPRAARRAHGHLRLPVCAGLADGGGLTEVWRRMVPGQADRVGGAPLPRCQCTQPSRFLALPWAALCTHRRAGAGRGASEAARGPLPRGRGRAALAAAARGRGAESGGVRRALRALRARTTAAGGFRGGLAGGGAAM
mmetsp:Transcript_41680/g.131252  ORF Transcript_41680/g.131252 Transcript_41680/m.131252 type:complete len:214 (-) Transcript_41680:2228-2869(-)